MCTCVCACAYGRKGFLYYVVCVSSDVCSAVRCLYLKYYMMHTHVHTHTHTHSLTLTLTHTHTHTLYQLHVNAEHIKLIIAIAQRSKDIATRVNVIGTLATVGKLSQPQLTYAHTYIHTNTYTHSTLTYIHAHTHMHTYTHKRRHKHHQIHIQSVSVDNAHIEV